MYLFLTLVKGLFVIFLFLFQTAVSATTLTEVEESCGAVSCVKPFYKKQNVKVDLGVQKKLFSLAYDFSQIWGDTILEGDIEDYGDVFLDKISKIYKDRLFLAYEIQYWMHAVDRSTGFDGQVIEKAIINKDFSNHYISEKGAARFFPITKDKY